MKRTVPPSSSRRPEALGFSFQEDLWFGDFDDESARQAAASSMAAMAGRIMGARPFPAAAQRLVQLTRDENTSITKVVRVLESDPGLSQRVLRLVNSAGYGLRVRCTSLNHATALLGQQRLQQIATSAVLLNHFGRTSDETKRKQEHGALVASLCRYLAIHLGLPQEDLFTCGLLHDLGQLMMLDEGQPGYKELVISHEREWDSLHIAEREMLGFDHAVLAAHVLASWSIPSPVPEVISLHHQPALAHRSDPKISAMVQTLRFADHMSHLLETKNVAEGAARLADSEAASYLGFSEMQIAAMWEDLRQLHRANLNRRMDIQDIAPRSLSVPASLSPRAQAITDAPGYLSQAPWSSSETTSAVSNDESEDEGLPPSLIPTGRSLAPNYGDSSESAGSSCEETADAPIELPRLPSDRPSDMGAQPEIFPCAICYGPTFGARCPVCSAHVCSAHQTSTRQWCMACEDEFQRYAHDQVVPSLVKIAAAAALLVAVGSSWILGSLEVALGVLGISATAGLGAYAGYHGLLKSRFKRQRPPAEQPPPTLAARKAMENYAGLPREATDRLGGQRFSEKEPSLPDMDERDAPETRTRDSRETQQLGSLAPPSAPLSSPPSQATFPSPSIEGLRRRLDSARSPLSDAPTNSQFSWPPSGRNPDTAVSTPRISVLPTLGNRAPEIRFADDAPDSRKSTESSRAIAHPSEFEPSEVTADSEGAPTEDELDAHPRGEPDSTTSGESERPAWSGAENNDVFPEEEPSGVGTEFAPPGSSQLSSVHPEAEEQVPSALRKSRAPAEEAEPSDRVGAPHPAIAPPCHDAPSVDLPPSARRQMELDFGAPPAMAPASNTAESQNRAPDVDNGTLSESAVDRVSTPGSLSQNAEEPPPSSRMLLSDRSNTAPDVAVDSPLDDLETSEVAAEVAAEEDSTAAAESLVGSRPAVHSVSALAGTLESVPSPDSQPHPAITEAASSAESFGQVAPGLQSGNDATQPASLDAHSDLPQSPETLAAGPPTSPGPPIAPLACAPLPETATVVIRPPVIEPPRTCTLPSAGLVSIGTVALDNIGSQKASNNQNRQASGEQ